MGMISLPELGDSDLLIPLLFPNQPWRQSKVRFDLDIEVPGDESFADEVRIGVHRDGLCLYEEIYTSNLIVAGEHQWWWDGFDNKQIFDTRQLKGQGLKVKLQVKKDGQVSEDELPLDNEAEKVEWVELRVDLKATTIDIDVFVDCQNEEDIAQAEFDRLRNLVLAGIGKYWSRDITVAGQRFKVKTTAHQREDKSEDLDIYVETGRSYKRSHNSGIIDASIFYNIGFFVNQRSDADQDFMATAAHEFGHAILEAFGGKSLSWGHKGTVGANPLAFWSFQDALPTAPSYPPAPAEIDLMYYYKDGAPPDLYDRLIAAEEDIRRLIWIAAVDFDED